MGARRVMAQYIPGSTRLYPTIDLASQSLAGTPTLSGMGELPLKVERVLRAAEYVVSKDGKKIMPQGWWVQVQLFNQRYFAEVATDELLMRVG